jgi:ferredoxin--NADP+ reductase
MLCARVRIQEDNFHMFRVVRKQSFTQDLYSLEIEIPPIAQKAQPGHHVDIRLNPDAPALTLPVAGFDSEAGTITVVERARDLSSEQLMMLQEGDEVFQVRGPLGSACSIDDVGKVALVGEGLGVASLLPRARAYKATGAYTICVIGFPSRAEVFWQDEFSQVSDELYVTTRDGSFGVNGNVAAPLGAICETHKDLERVVCIASLKSMRRAAKIAADRGVAARVCFDAIRPPVGSPGVFDAPADSQETFEFARAAELDAGGVDFDKLIARERAILKDAEEAASGS